jgi:hypothetical protein
MSLALRHLVFRLLRQEARRSECHRRRFMGTTVLAMVFLWSVSATQGQLTATQRAHGAFASISAAGTLLSALAGFRHMVAWPREQCVDGTREILMQTRISGLGWFLSGLLAHGWQAICEVLPSVPFFAISLGMGGASFPECLRSLALMAATGLLAGSAGLLGAAGGGSERASLATALAILSATLVGGPLANAWGHSLYPTASYEWNSALGSLAAFTWMLQSPFTRDPSALHAALAMQGWLTLIFLALAARRLSRRNFSVANSGGNPTDSAELSPRLLWLPAGLLLAVVPAFIGAIISHNRISMAYVLAALYLLHLSFKIGVGLESTCWIRNERRAGMLALEQATGRPANEIYERHYRSLRGQLVFPLILLALGNLAVAAAILLAPALFLEEKLFLTAVLAVGIAELWVDTRALVWQGLLEGLKQPQAGQSLGWVVAKVILASWLVVWGLNLLYQGASLAENEITALFICRAAMSIGANLALAKSARNRLCHTPWTRGTSEREFYA